MTYFITGVEDRTIAYIDVFNNDISVDVSSFINIRRYSEMFLIRTIYNDAEQFVDDFEKIHNISDWLDDYMRENPDAGEEDINKEIKDFIKTTAEKYNLSYIVD